MARVAGAALLAKATFGGNGGGPLVACADLEAPQIAFESATAVIVGRCRTIDEA